MQSTQLFTTLTTGIKGFLANRFFPFLALLSVIVFLWGVVTAITASESDQSTEGKKLMIYGLVGFIMFTILWGLFYFSISPEIVPTNPALLQNQHE